MINYKELKKVSAQIQTTQQALIHLTDKNDFLNYQKIKLAENIGKEMLKNGLIAVSEKQNSEYVTLSADVLVYDRNTDASKCIKEEPVNYLNNDALSNIATTVAILSRYRYWKDELWRSRPATKSKYKDYDTAEVNNALLTLAFKNAGIYSSACGCGWAGNTSLKNTIEYLDKYQDLFDDYCQWQLEQR